MPDQPTRLGGKAETAEPLPDANNSSKGGVRRWLSDRRLLLVLLGGSILLNAALLACCLAQRSGERASAPAAELPLGDYRFAARKAGESNISGADFSLHIALLNGVDPATHQRVVSRQHRIEQAVEELLRRAHGGDFEDPALGDLKRQLQERINGILEMKAISEVVITGLVLHRSESGPAAAVDTTATASWSGLRNSRLEASE
ncbi:MAG: flagellar basal body-associated FliL family protein [Rhodopirellula sp.]|nr:flagellar basal body-associated FliL family protein [Rhodopirellula sp.]